MFCDQYCAICSNQSIPMLELDLPAQILSNLLFYFAICYIHAVIDVFCANLFVRKEPFVTKQLKLGFKNIFKLLKPFVLVNQNPGLSTTNAFGTLNTFLNFFVALSDFD